jgi:threonine/homoserine/homoserine lactone efflux protein
VKAAGGLYLLWMAWQAARKLRLHGQAGARPAPDAPGGFAHIYLRGAAMHLTNPKAVFVWLSVVSLALPGGSRLPDTLGFVGSCVLISASVFCCYALAFSTAAARRGYRAAERWVNLGLAGVFAYAGVRMLLSSQAR